ncbi:hypothetical protein [Caldimonas brevitalea]|uniref:Uncharacterized protein n=1 Tax=Caldimonas brevitalea TaxID=413882 RepID=A0A0G3BK24_9BURK|nr:hypothetical protein [Caldimonas brevitalea]AKJ29779.1 hypothetical protein AAW51_3088 [Caldimonas brevitalea]
MSARAAGRRALLCWPLLVLLAGCSATPSAAPPDLRSAQALRQEIETAVGDAACTSDAQCRTLPMGAKACGGPERYLPWSTARSDGARLTALSRELETARRAQQRESGMVSNCSMVTDPGARCAEGRCVLRSGSGAASSAY